MVRQYVTTMITSGMKKATKEPISMKRSSLRTQLPFTKTLSSLWRPITGIGIDTPTGRTAEREREEIYIDFFQIHSFPFVQFSVSVRFFSIKPRASSVYSIDVSDIEKHLMTAFLEILCIRAQ